MISTCVASSVHISLGCRNFKKLCALEMQIFFFCALLCSHAPSHRRRALCNFRWLRNEEAKATQYRRARVRTGGSWAWQRTVSVFALLLIAQVSLSRHFITEIVAVRTHMHTYTHTHTHTHAVHSPKRHFTFGCSFVGQKKQQNSVSSGLFHGTLWLCVCVTSLTDANVRQIDHDHYYCYHHHYQPSYIRLFRCYFVYSIR